MTTVCIAGLFFIVPWLLLGVFVAGMDHRLRRQHHSALETRAWQEKVDAMRRLQDIEGDA
jgi:hypothetical protein